MVIPEPAKSNSPWKNSEESLQNFLGVTVLIQKKQKQMY